MTSTNHNHAVIDRYGMYPSGEAFANNQRFGAGCFGHVIEQLAMHVKHVFNKN